MYEIVLIINKYNMDLDVYLLSALLLRLDSMSDIKETSIYW